MKYTLTAAFMLYASAVGAWSPKDLRLSDINIYSNSAPMNSVIQGKDVFQTDFVIRDRDVEFAEVTSRRGKPRSNKRTHRGVDIAAPLGAEITYLGLNGENAVVSVGYQKRGCGNYIFLRREVDGETIETLFGHLSDVYVKDSDEIKPGTVIGLVGKTGDATGPHLHYEKRTGTRSIKLAKM